MDATESARVYTTDDLEREHDRQILTHRTGLGRVLVAALRDLGPVRCGAMMRRHGIGETEAVAAVRAAGLEDLEDLRARAEGATA